MSVIKKIIIILTNVNGWISNGRRTEKAARHELSRKDGR